MNSDLERIFGPYEAFPKVYLSHLDSKLKRIVYEQESESEIQNSKKEAHEKMTWKQFFLYFLFLYTPPSERKKKNAEFSEIKTRIYREDVLCEAKGFEVLQKTDGYYVQAR